ncbi:hypothetical protein HX045_03360 [Myroides odoratimimus]|uniref:Uncharacterized protein n=3 Tax=Myroides odoratimimus TaxID=76832 RepID=A0A0S7EF43_9FLAO|nr:MULTISPECIES: hypothetical protein [Myroides]AJA69283.1 hypothetical protein MYRA21_2153 [Myroides sp. A21]ALU26509.1 hypothetical protein AS202_10255 [Myroides odoratimimus]APA92567.1 hypothetical protein BK054_10125 [Myroides sp. ZB35]EHO12000.1 hypothetical protein HMPREF9712_00247 [Myroides odoratimimus CCUG 10230]EHO13080.1 hypothetical protein HMPREF9714_01058 [Myroides odoratimimus CCUG 12901]
MLEQITKLVEQISSSEVAKGGITSDLTSAVTKETGDSIINGLKDSVSSGDISGLTNLLSGQASNIASNPIVTGMIGNLISGLVGKLGLSEGVAGSFANGVVPQVVSAIVAKIQGGESGFDMSTILSGLGQGGAQDMLGSLLGGKEGLGGAIDKLKGLF